MTQVIQVIDRVQRVQNRVRVITQRTRDSLRRLGDAGRRATDRIVRGAGNAMRSLVRLATVAGAAGAALAAAGKASAFAFIKESVDDTVDSLRFLRQTSALLKLPPEVVSAWERFGLQTGVEKEDTAAILGAFNTAVSEAAFDPEAPFTKLFQDMNVQLVDAQGNLRSISHIFTDFAIASTKLGNRRGFYLAQIFGDGDALKAAEMFDNIARKGIAGMNAFKDQELAEGNLVTGAQVEAAKRYEAATSNLRETYFALKRLVFEGLEPTLTRIANGLERVLSDKKARIADYFVKTFENFYRLLREISIVFTRTDFGVTFFDESRIVVQRDWLYDVHDLIMAIAGVLGILGRAAIAAGRAVDALIKDLTGFSFFDFFANFDTDRLEVIFTKIVKYLASLFRDVGRLFGAEFVKGGGGMETGLGKWADKAFDGLKARFDAFSGWVKSWVQTIGDYLRTGFAEALAFQSGEASFASLTTSLGQVLGVVLRVSSAVGKLIEQFKKVVIDEQRADRGYEWIERLADRVEYITGVFGDFVDIMRAMFGWLDTITMGFVKTHAAAILLAGGSLFAIARGLNAISGGLLLLGAKAAFSALATGFSAVTTALAGTAAGQTIAAAFTALGTALAGLAAPIALVATAVGVFASAYAAWNKMKEAEESAKREREAIAANDRHALSYGKAAAIATPAELARYRSRWGDDAITQRAQTIIDNGGVTAWNKSTEDYYKKNPGVPVNFYLNGSGPYEGEIASMDEFNLMKRDYSRMTSR
ncbi:hypothetical protein [Fulvimarina manganoxydans]|nr:hypothetical protein [Fulvimarina manganoxydans]